MIVNMLIESIIKMCDKAIEDFRLPVANGSLRKPNVINAFLPPKRSNSDDDFPFVLVRANSCSSDTESEQVNVSIIIGCYSEDYDGYMHCVNVAERIKQAITQLPNGLLDRKYSCTKPIEWVMSNEQMYPLWQIDMSTKWIYRCPENTDDF